MSKSIRPDQLGAAVQAELKLYSESVRDRVNAAGKAASQKLLKLTKTNAPQQTGSLAKHLAIKEQNLGATGCKQFVLHAKAPDHRIFHLAVHGHALPNGGRARGNSFLKDAMDQVLPEYEEAVKEAVQE